jgi:plastocyanin
MTQELVRRAAVAVALLAVTASAAACSTSKTGKPAVSSGKPAAPSGVLTVHVTDQLRFQPSTLRAHVGTVRIKIVNDGSYPHNFSVPALHTTSATVSGNPGEQQATVTLHVPRPGSYAFICTFHASAGMRGTLVVQK